MITAEGLANKALAVADKIMGENHKESSAYKSGKELRDICISALTEIEHNKLAKNKGMSYERVLSACKKYISNSKKLGFTVVIEDMGKTILCDNYSIIKLTGQLVGIDYTNDEDQRVQGIRKNYYKIFDRDTTTKRRKLTADEIAFIHGNAKANKKANGETDINGCFVYENMVFDCFRLSILIKALGDNNLEIELCDPIEGCYNLDRKLFIMNEKGEEAALAGKGDVEYYHKNRKG